MRIILEVVAFLLLPIAAFGGTTTISQEIVGPDGRPASGEATIRINRSCQSGADYVGSSPIVISFTGMFSAALVPNDSCTPSGTSYAVTWSVAGFTWNEVWVVPTSASPVLVNSVVVASTAQPSTFFYNATTGGLFVGPRTGFGTVANRIFGQSFGAITAINPNTALVTGAQPTIFSTIVEDNGTTLTDAGYDMFVDTHASGTRGSFSGRECDGFLTGAGTTDYIFGCSGFAEQDAGTTLEDASLVGGGSALTGGTTTYLTSVIAGSPTVTGGTISQSAIGFHAHDQKGYGANGSWAYMGDDQTGGGKQARFGLGVTEFHDQVNHVSANETILNGGFNGAYVGGLYFANPAAPATYLHSIRSSHSSSVDAQNILDFSVNDHTGANAVDVMSLDGSGQATFHGLLNMASSALLPRNASDPGTCTAGQIEFNSTSTAFKGCAATNTWSSLGSGGSSGGTGAASGGGASVLTLGTDCSAATPCNYRWSNRVVAITTSAAATQSGGTGTTYEYVDFTSGRFTVAIPGGMTVTCNANCDVVAGTAFPVDSIPLYRWVVTLAGAWNMAQANYNVRSVYSVSPATAGANLTSSFVSGKQTFSLDPTSAFVVTGSVDDTGASVTKPSRTVPGSPSGACSANNEVVLSTATGNLFTCTAGVWHLVGGGATGGGTTVGGVTTVSTSTAYPMLSTIRQGITNFTNATPPAVSIAQAGTGGFDNLWCEIVQWLPATNSNNGLVITPASPSTINGNAALTLFVGGQSKICSDGVNYTATVPVPVWMEDNGYAVGIYHGVRILDSNYPLSENTTAQTCATTATLGGTNGDEITLTGNCTLSIGSPGFAETEKTVKICQDATGNHTVTWPATMHAPMTVSAGASTCSVQVFQGFASNNVWYAMSPGVTGQ